MREFVSNHIAVILTTGAVLFGGAYYFQVQEQRNDAREDTERAACQAQYNQAFIETSRIRAQISAASDEAQTDLLAGVGKIILGGIPTANPRAQAKRAEEFRKLFREFAAARDKVEQDRAANPLPTIPNC